MPFVKPEVRRRVLITGEIGSGKTHALRSFPGSKIVLVFPGENGHDTLVRGDGTPLDSDTQVFVWQHDEKKTSTQVIEEVRKETIQLIATPELMTFCGDGFHQFYEFIIDAMSGGEYFKGKRWQTESREDPHVVDPRCASQAETWMVDWLLGLNQSKVPYIVMTTWGKGTGVRPAKALGDGKKEKWQDIPQHRMPALYGKASEKILGRFGVCVYASVLTKRVEIGKPDRIREYRWQTQKDAEVGACEIKGDAEITAKIPKYVPASWPELAKYLDPA